ncbi:hypothetical protein LAZ41_00615, partial [Cereibacter sphaeroides]|nr:hypothetical protein [Cereibacter sphaeroides]
SRPVTGPGLEQRGPVAELIGPPEGAPLDTRQHVPEPDRARVNRATDLREGAYRRAGPESQEIRARWMQERHDAALERGATPEEVASLERALEAHVLGADVEIHVQEPGCEGFRIVTVADLLAEPGRWDGAVTLDPLEPDYRGGSHTGKLFLLGSTPRLYSQAHGGQVWRLEAGRPTIVCEPGGGARVTGEVLELLSGTGQLFNCGSALVTVEGGHVIELNEHSLALVLGRMIRFLRPNPKGGLTPVDPPVAAVRQILSLGRARNLPGLETLARTPQVAADRSLLDRPGYDPGTGIYFLFDRDEFPPLPREATERQLRAAIRILEAPFDLFPLAGP